MKRLIKNGTLVNPEGESGKLDILIDEGIIVKIAQQIDEPADEVIDADNMVVFPALVDMHCHLRDPGLEYKEDVISGTKAAAAGGYAAVACMPNTDPVVDNAALVDYLIRKGKEKGYAKVYPIGAISKGEKGEELSEMAAMKQAGAVAFSDDGKPVRNSGLML